MNHQNQKEENDNIEFHIDFGDEECGDTLTMFVIRQRQTRMAMASVVPSKNAREFIVRPMLPKITDSEGWQRRRW